MAYSINSLTADCYENTSVLINKFNIKDENKLSVMEQSITSVMIAKAIMEIPFENVDFEFYKNLHKFVFSDIYEWAGCPRKVDMSKKGTVFCPVEEIEQRGTNIFARLKKTDFLKKCEDDFIVDFVDLYCELNYLHPFREGNGRIQRLFLTMLVSDLGKKLNFADIDKDLLMIATIKSVSGDVFMLRDIFKEYIR